MINYKATQMPRRGNISAPLNDLLQSDACQFFVVDSILHFGEGKAYADTEALSDFAPTKAYDLYSDNERKRNPDLISLDKKYDTVFACYVYNVVLPETRAAIHRRLLAISRTLIWVVRADRINGTPYEDGVLTKNNTFQKSYTLQEAHREWPNATVLSHHSGRYITMLE